MCTTIIQFVVSANLVVLEFHKVYKPGLQIDVGAGVMFEDVGQVEIIEHFVRVSVDRGEALINAVGMDESRVSRKKVEALM